jgi:transmembrane 9 superfamily protein 2/4
LPGQAVDKLIHSPPHKQAIEAPVRVNQIPRQVPEQPFYMKTVPAIMIGGILPFGAIFIELFFILSSLWYHRVCYYGLHCG